MFVLSQELKKYGQLKLNVSMKKHTSFKIGGQVKYFLKVNDKSKLVDLVNFLNSQAIDYFILGCGTNILWPDENYLGVVIKLELDKISIDNKEQKIKAQSGVKLSFLVSQALKNSLGGLEWAVGIPGTLGGAVRGNAGAMGSSIADIVEKVIFWQDGEIYEFSNQECGFKYRHSYFKDNPSSLILEAVLQFTTVNKQEIIKKFQENLLARNKKQMYDLPSAGSFFKNIEIEKWPGNLNDLPAKFREYGKIPSGWLIEQAGLKGLRKGDAQIYEKHGNFIVNLGQATQADVLALVEIIKDKIYTKYNLNLEEEVQIINFN